MTTKFQPTDAVPIENLPGVLPYVTIPKDIDADAVLRSSIQNLQYLKNEHLWAESFWRDLLSFTGVFRTFHTPRTIAAAWQELSARNNSSDFKLTPETAKVVQLGPIGWIEGRFTFKVGGRLPGEGSGIIFVVPTEDQGWKIWLISTLLESVNTFGNPDIAPTATKQLVNGAAKLNGSACEQKLEVADVLIVGAGQNGICLAARLKALGVESVLVEQEDQVGGNWTSRYDSVKLHTGKYFAHLPFEDTFASSEYPYFLRGLDLAKGYREYVHRWGLDVRVSTIVTTVEWIAGSRSWMVSALRHGKRYAMQAKHIVFATGAGGQQPKMPLIPDRDVFPGISIHSKNYKSSTQWKGKKGVVVGTANTGHDVAVDMVAAGLASVTLIQRNPTPVIPWSWFSRPHQQLYHENAITVDSDRREYSLPLSFYHNLSNTMMKQLSTDQPEHFNALERAGFRIVRVPNVVKIMLERQGGHYLDVGGSQMIIDGAIKMKGGDIAKYAPTGLEFADGSTLEADVIVWCTGFENNMRTMVASIVGKEMEEKLDHHWYLDKEGEVRGAFKPIGHERIWYTGGGVALARFYSRFLALQIKADLEGVPFEPYKKTP